MSKPKRRTMRRLKRTLGVTALILALLIAAIPDIGHADDTIKTTASLQYAWKDTQTVDPCSGDAYFQEVKLDIDDEIQSSMGGPTDFYRLVMVEFTDVGATGFATHIHRYKFELQYVPYSFVYDENNNVKDGVEVDGFGKPTDATFERFKDDIDIATDNRFIVKFDIQYKFLPHQSVPFYMSVYKNDADTYIASSDTDAPTTNQSSASVGNSFDVTFGGEEANNGFTLDVYINANPKEQLNVSDERSYRYDTSGKYYMLPVVDSEQQSATPATALNLKNVNRDNGVKGMYIPAVDYYLHVMDKTAVDANPAHPISAQDAKDAEAQFISIAKEKGFSGVPDYSDSTIDLIDWMKLSISDDNGDGPDYFNNYQVLVAFPKVNSEPYEYWAIKESVRDKYRIAYRNQDGWHDMEINDFASYFGENMHSITLQFDGTVEEAVVYIARGSRSVISIDRREIPGSESFKVDVNWQDHSEEELHSNVYALLDEVASQSTESSDNEIQELQQTAQGFCDAIDEAYNYRQYSVVSVCYKGDADGTNDATDIFTDGDSWGEYAYSASITMATKDWDYNADDSDGVLYGKVAVYGYKNSKWELIKTIEDATNVTFSTDQDYDSNKYYILVYYASADESTGMMYGDDNRTEIKADWTYPTSVGDATLKPWHGELPAGTYWLKVDDTYNKGEDTYIKQNLRIDAVNESYYTMCVETGPINGSHSPLDISKYGSVAGELRVQMALPISMATAKTGEVTLVLYNQNTHENCVYDQVTIENESVIFDPTIFTAPMEFALFYNPERTGGKFNYQYVMSTGTNTWMENADPHPIMKEIGTTWTMYCQKPHNESSLENMQGLIESQIGDALANASVEYFDLTLWETKLTETQIYDIGLNEITMKIPFASAIPGSTVYVYAYDGRTADPSIKEVARMEIKSNSNQIVFPITSQMLAKSDDGEQNPYAIVMIPPRDSGLRVEDYSGISNTMQIDADPRDKPDNECWVLRVEKNTNNADPGMVGLKEAFKNQYPNDYKNVSDFYFFDMNFYDENENLITDIGNIHYTITIPLPSDAKVGDRMYLWKYDIGTSSATELSKPITGESISFDITKTQPGQWNPYMLAVVPQESGEEKTYPLRVDDSASTLTSYVGGASSPTHVKDPTWKLVIKDDFADTALIKSKLAEIGGEYLKDDVLAFPYDIRLCYDNGGEVTPEDYNGTEITVTLPFPLEMRNLYENGDTVELWMSNKDSKVLRLNADAVIDSGAKTITFSTTEILSYNPYAIVYIPQEKVDPLAESLEVIAWPSAVPAPDSSLTPGADFMQLTPGLPKATTDVKNHNVWKLLVSQYTPDSAANATAIVAALKNPANSSVTGYIANDWSTSSTSAATLKTGSKTTVTTTTTTTSQKKSIIKAYNVELWEYDETTKTYPKKVSNDNFSRLGDVGVTVTLPLNGTLIGNKGKASIWTLDPDSGALEPVATAIGISSAAQEYTFKTYHFSQYAIIYTPAEEVSTDEQSETTDDGSASKSGASNSGSSGNSGNSSSTGASNSSTAGTTNNSGAGSGGGGNRAGGDGKVDMPRTADATTYKAIFILILLAFGAFELVSSMPSKKKAAAQQQVQAQPQTRPQAPRTGNRRRR